MFHLALLTLVTLPIVSSMTICVTAPPAYTGRTLVNIKKGQVWFLL